MNCSECGKEIQSNKKLCEECKKRLLREKIISDTYGRDGPSPTRRIFRF